MTPVLPSEMVADLRAMTHRGRMALRAAECALRRIAIARAFPRAATSRRTLTMRRLGGRRRVGAISFNHR